MKRLILGTVVMLAACDETAMSSAPGGGFQEFLVIGSGMSFEQCRARGGLIIRDNGSPMVACDPNVIRAPVPPDEFNHPASQAAAAAAAAQS